MKCWSCKGSHMEPWETLGKDWHKCSDCGATYIDMPKIRGVKTTSKKVKK